MILTFWGKTGWRELEIGRGPSGQICPVHAIEQYLHYSKISFGPLFQRVTRDDQKATGDRLSDKPVARLRKNGSFCSLGAGLASSADLDEQYIQKQLGHTSPEMMRSINAEETVSG